MASTAPRRHAFPVLNVSSPPFHSSSLGLIRVVEWHTDLELSQQDQFLVDEDYEFTKELGQGAYGVVWSAVVIHAIFFFASIKCIRIFTDEGYFGGKNS